MNTHGGNIRELENAVERMVVLAKGSILTKILPLRCFKAYKKKLYQEAATVAETR